LPALPPLPKRKSPPTPTAVNDKAFDLSVNAKHNVLVTFRDVLKISEFSPCLALP